MRCDIIHSFFIRQHTVVPRALNIGHCHRSLEQAPVKVRGCSETRACLAADEPQRNGGQRNCRQSVSMSSCRSVSKSVSEYISQSVGGKRGRERIDGDAM